MRILFFVFLFLLVYNVQGVVAQRSVLVVQVQDSAEVFTRALPRGTVLLDKNLNQFFVLTATAQKDSALWQSQYAEIGSSIDADVINDLIDLKLDTLRHYATRTHVADTLLNYTTTSSFESLNEIVEDSTAWRSRNTLFLKDVTVSGDLTVLGTQNVASTDSVTVTNSVITLNEGETGSGITKGYGGIMLDRGSANNYFFGFSEAREALVLGEINETSDIATLNPVATRRNDFRNNAVPFFRNDLFFYDFDSSFVFNNKTLYVDSIQMQGEIITGATNSINQSSLLATSQAVIDYVANLTFHHVVDSLNNVAILDGYENLIVNEGVLVYNNSADFYHVEQQTTNATATTVASIPVSTGEIITIKVNALSKDNTNQNANSYSLDATYYANSSSLLSVGTVDKTVREMNSDCDVVFTKSGSNVLIQVVGAASKTFNWRVIIEILKL